MLGIIFLHEDARRAPYFTAWAAMRKLRGLSGVNVSKITFRYMVGGFCESALAVL